VPVDHQLAHMTDDQFVRHEVAGSL